MNKFELREYKAPDIPALSRLWKRSFGDSQGFLDAFFAALPSMGSGLVAECDGVICGAAYTITEQQLAYPDGVKRRLGYIYGVSVDERFQGRGIGAALVKGVYALSKERGAEIVCTLPAEDSLYGWYDKLIEVKCALHRSVRTVSPQTGGSCREISAEEYMHLREALLAGRPRLIPSMAVLEFQGQMLKEYSGGLYVVEGGIAAAYADGDCGIIRELLLPQGGDVASAASHLAAAMGVKTAKLFEASAGGKNYIASELPLPTDCVWNLSLD